jgi:hypothetical protein
MSENRNHTFVSVSIRERYLSDMPRSGLSDEVLEELQEKALRV